jgi:hypothetical protein
MKRMIAARPMACAFLLLAVFSSPTLSAAAIGEDVVARAISAVEVQKQAEKKALAAKKAAEEKERVLAEKKAAQRKTAEEKALAAKKAAEEKARRLAEARAATQKEAEEKALAAKKAAEEKAHRLAEARAAQRKAAEEKALAARRAIEEKALADTRGKVERAQARAEKNAAGAWPAPKAAKKPDDVVRPEKASEAEIRRLTRKCNEALKNRDFLGAQEALQTLELLLPEKSLTLLRLRAWFAMSSGEDEAARDIYREILDRLFNDANSAINLAVLEARAGRVDEARRIISDFSNRLPDSERLKSVRQAFGLSQ